jgi:hypothetical protein
MPIDDDNEDLILSDSHAQLVIQAQKEQILVDQSQKIITCAFDRCTEMEVHYCHKCERPYCIMHSNRFSPNFCKECFANLACIESKFTRTFEDFDAKTDRLVITKQSCAKYYMDGPDWPFLTLWIDSLNNHELKTIWNFHFFVMKTIEAENEVRKIKKYKKLREMPSPVKVIKSANKITKTIQVTTTEELKKKFKKQGLPDDIIEQMVLALNNK